MRKTLFGAALLALVISSCAELDNPSTPVVPPTPDTPDTPDTPVVDPAVVLTGYEQGDCILLGDGTFRVGFSVTGAVTNATDETRWGIEYRFTEDDEWTALYAEDGVTEQTLTVSDAIVPSALFDDQWKVTVSYRTLVDNGGTIIESEPATASLQWAAEVTTGDATDITTSGAVVSGYASGFDFTEGATVSSVGILYGADEEATDIFAYR